MTFARNCVAITLLASLALSVALRFAHAQGCPAPSTPPSTAIPTPEPARIPERAEGIKKLLASDRFHAIALGDSIMQGWPADLLNSAIGGTALNIGFGRDTTEDVLWRLDEFDWSKQSPRYVLLLVGTNDLGHMPCDIYWGIRSVVTKIRHYFPAATVIVTSILPRGVDMRVAEGGIDGLNNQLKRSAGSGSYLFLDAHDEFLCGHHTPCSLYLPGNLHLTRAGYSLLSTALSHLISTGR